MGKNKKLTFGMRGDLPKDVEESRIIPFILSTYTKDRHHTILNQESWSLENYRKNPVVAYQHNLSGGMCSEPNPDFIIGKSINIDIEGSGVDRSLVADAQFEPGDINPLAEKIFRKILFGSLSRSSVGFIEVGDGHYGDGEEGEGRLNETYYFSGQELLEWSVVNIPSNPDAGKRELDIRRMREDGYSALMYAYKELGGKFRMSQIENFRVRDILDLLDGKDLDINESDPERLRKLLGEAEAKADMYVRQCELLKIKLTGLQG